MALLKCKECGREISKSAKQCPGCGAKRPRRAGVFAWTFATVVLIAIVGSQIDGGSSQDTGQRAANDATTSVGSQRAMALASTLKKASRNPERFEVEEAIAIKSSHAVCMTYRTENGFGGMNRDQAVLAPDGRTIKTSEMSGFTRLWNAECADKSGLDVAPAIRWLD